MFNFPKPTQSSPSIQLPHPTNDPHFIPQDESTASAPPTGRELPPEPAPVEPAPVEPAEVPSQGIQRNNVEIGEDQLVMWNPDRPMRTRKDRPVYDAASGTFKDRCK